MKTILLYIVAFILILVVFFREPREKSASYESLAGQTLPLVEARATHDGAVLVPRETVARRTPLSNEASDLSGRVVRSAPKGISRSQAHDVTSQSDSTPNGVPVRGNIDSETVPSNTNKPLESSTITIETVSSRQSSVVSRQSSVVR